MYMHIYIYIYDTTNTNNNTEYVGSHAKLKAPVLSWAAQIIPAWRVPCLQDFTEPHNLCMLLDTKRLLPRSPEADSWVTRARFLKDVSGGTWEQIVHEVRHGAVRDRQSISNEYLI